MDEASGTVDVQIDARFTRLTQMNGCALLQQYGEAVPTSMISMG
jgi:hypothetical protein